jgi:hypothetical protein
MKYNACTFGTRPTLFGCTRKQNAIRAVVLIAPIENAQQVGILNNVVTADVGGAWPTNKLTYSFRNYSRKLDSRLVRSIVSKALQVMFHIMSLFGCKFRFILVKQ